MEVGHISIHDPEGKLVDLKENMWKNRAIAGTIPTPIVFGAMAAYNGSTAHIPAMNKELTRRMDLAYRRINEIEGLFATKPLSAFLYLS